MEDKLNVRSIVEEFLIEHDYDGLFHEFTGCACRRDDLFPCEYPETACEAGYLHGGDEEFNWYIKRERPHG